MPEDLARTLGRAETTTLEFKREAKDRNAIKKAICALANDLTGAGGGDLLIGVANDGTPRTVPTGDEALLALTQIRDEGRILERPAMVVEKGTFDGSPVIHIRVHASNSAPVRFDGVAWVRPGPLTVRASAEDERILSERRATKAVPFDGRTARGTALEDLDLAMLESTYISAAVDPDVLEENGRPLPQQLRSLRLLDVNEIPTHLGLLLGGFDPTVNIPGAYVQFVRYDGTSAEAAVRDEEEIRDNFITAARTISSLLQAHLTHRVVHVGPLEERTVADYPSAALREAIMNSLTHRNYEGSNAPVRILWFDDRVEISNPGGPYGAVTAENFDRVNDYRNPSLAAAMKTLGYVNRFGRGIERMRHLMHRNGNPPPEFIVDRSSWTVTLRRSAVLEVL
ncbi:MAG: ATP-dependent helicase RecG [Actinomycetota bacterium]|nr:ATP-dependent helicase RecG [Actinomycetota bacterium]